MSETVGIEALRKRAENLAGQVLGYRKKILENPRIGEERKGAVRDELSSILYKIETALDYIKNNFPSDAIKTMDEVEDDLRFSSILHPEDSVRLNRTRNEIRALRKSVKGD